MKISFMVDVEKAGSGENLKSLFVRAENFADAAAAGAIEAGLYGFHVDAPRDGDYRVTVKLPGAPGSPFIIHYRDRETPAGDGKNNGTG